MARAGHRANLVIAAALAALGSGGCMARNLVTAERMKNGLVLILPGIEGRSKYNADLLCGLADGGVPCAIEIFDWGTIVPLGGLVNLVAIERNREQARRIADRVVQYQRDYPNRPVHLVGHSGGGGLAVLALEALPPGHKVSSALLLAAAISPDYDLTRALHNTEAGIWNFYSSADVGYLKVGTGLFGTIDRRHTRAAGAVGFKMPTTTRESVRSTYAKLHSVSYKPAMAQAGHRGGHAGWTGRRFASLWLAPVILAASDDRAGYSIALDDHLSRFWAQEKSGPPTRPNHATVTQMAEPGTVANPSSVPFK